MQGGLQRKSKGCARPLMVMVPVAMMVGLMMMVGFVEQLRQQHL
jgi:hypothetical protein